MSLRPAIRMTQHCGHVLVTGPDSEPVTVAEMRDYLGIGGSADDNLLAEMIVQARNEIEETTGIAMLPQTWQLSLDMWPGDRQDWWDGVRQGAIGDLRGHPGWLALPRYPLSAVDSVTVYNEASVAAVVPVAGAFDVDTYSKPGRIALRSGRTWPVALRPTNAIVIVYDAGYADAASVPAGVKRAVTAMAAYLYSHRGDGCDVGDAYAMSGAAATMARHAVARL